MLMLILEVIMMTCLLIMEMEIWNWKEKEMYKLRILIQLIMTQK